MSMARELVRKQASTSPLQFGKPNIVSFLASADAPVLEIVLKSCLEELLRERASNARRWSGLAGFACFWADMSCNVAVPRDECASHPNGIHEGDVEFAVAGRGRLDVVVLWIPARFKVLREERLELFSGLTQRFIRATHRCSQEQDFANVPALELERFVDCLLSFTPFLSAQQWRSLVTKAIVVGTGESFGFSSSYGGLDCGNVIVANSLWKVIFLPDWPLP